jgi:hypothetical protein
MTGTNCDLFTHISSRSYLNHLVALQVLKCRTTNSTLCRESSVHFNYVCNHKTYENCVRNFSQQVLFENLSPPIHTLFHHFREARIYSSKVCVILDMKLNWQMSQNFSRILQY